MLTVVHTFDAPDRDRLLGEVRMGLNTVKNIEGFKFASLNEQINSNEIMLFSKWENRTAYENWAETVGDNKAFKQATPQMFDVLEEKY